MSTKAQRQEAAKVLGEKGGQMRWKDSTEQERQDFAHAGAAKRWKSYARAVEDGELTRTRRGAEVTA